jgi:hypothetical protein
MLAAMDYVNRQKFLFCTLAEFVEAVYHHVIKPK